MQSGGSAVVIGQEVDDDIGDIRVAYSLLQHVDV